MVAKAWGSQTRPTEEVFFQDDGVSLCLLVNPRARTMRVIDFRAGPSAAKRVSVLSFARREGLEKIFTVVERDEVATWVRMGFTKEGSIPGFYKRSDAFLLGRSSRVESKESEEDPPLQSETRIAVSESPAPMGAITPSQTRMERTLLLAKVLAKKWPKEASQKHPPKIASVNEDVARSAVASACRSGRALCAFEPFGRGGVRRYFVTTTRGGFELHMAIESQACFANAYLELLQSPRTEADTLATSGAVGAFCNALQEEGIVSCFSLAPSDDIALSAVFLQNGFRRTGLLIDHLRLGETRKDAIVWSRKLANPRED